VLAIAAKVSGQVNNKNVILKCSTGDNSVEINELCGASMCVVHNYKIAKEDSINHPHGASQKRCMAFQKSTINVSN
jgi:hypothetical protein